MVLEVVAGAADGLLSWIGSGKLCPRVSRIAPLRDAEILLRNIMARKVSGNGVLHVTG